MSLKSEQKENSRHKILNSAAKLFRKNGYTATGVDAVMTDADLTAGAFYAHFSSKQNLLEESLKVSGSKMYESLAGASSDQISQALKDAIHLYLSTQHRDHPEVGCSVASLCTEISRSPAKVRKTLQAHALKWSQLLKRGLRKKTQNESLLLIAALLGTIQMSRVLEDKEMSDDFLEFAKKRWVHIFQGEKK